MKLKPILSEVLREGTASHFDSLLKDWSKRSGIEYEWKFKTGRNKKTQSYFVFKMTFDEFDNLPKELYQELNGLLRRFNVDFVYRNNNWTPVVE